MSAKKTESKAEVKTRRGFKGFGKPEKRTAAAIRSAIDTVDTTDRYVYYTGESYRAKRRSLRFRSLSTITEVGKPVPLSTLLERAANAVKKGEGFAPASVLVGLSNHQGNKPTVYFYLEKDGDGNFRAVRNVPFPSETVSKKPLEAGDIVIPAKAAAKKRTKAATKKAS